MSALGIDVGGTFTDAVLVSADRMVTAKVLSTGRQEEGVVAAAREVLERAGVEPGDVTHFVHGSTVATNALLERRLARTALVTTKGFRDLLFLGRQARPSLYRLHEAPTPPVVERRLCVEVDERMGPEGVIRALDEASVRRAAKRLARARVEAVAVCLLFAFRDPAHEARVAEILRGELPDAFVVASHEVAAEVREFERATTATVDAALGPPTGRYLSRLRAATEEAGLPEPHVMLSSGGVATLEQVAAHPAAMLLSGPAGGAVAARIVAEPPALGFDMGGTSCDTFFLAEGGAESDLTVQREVAGLPIRLPMVDIHTVSAGGGSIAWVDSGGALRVGPQSAGADPGPACYGRGGERAHRHRRQPRARPAARRVADRRRPEARRRRRPAAPSSRSASAPPRRRPRASSRSPSTRWCRRCAWSPSSAGTTPRAPRCSPSAAPGRCTPASWRPSSAPRACSACRPAASCRPSAWPPPSAAATSRAACCSRSPTRPTSRAVAGAGRRRATASPCAAPPTCATPASRSSCSCRSRTPRELEDAFHAEHERRYGHADRERAVELVTLRAAAVAPGAEVTLAATGDVERSRRTIRWDGDEVEAEVLTGDGLPPGTKVEGPAIVEFPETTCLVPPGWAGEADEHGILGWSTAAA